MKIPLTFFSFVFLVLTPSLFAETKTEYSYPYLYPMCVPLLSHDQNKNAALGYHHFVAEGAQLHKNGAGYIQDKLSPFVDMACDQFVQDYIASQDGYFGRFSGPAYLGGFYASNYFVNFALGFLIEGLVASLSFTRQYTHAKEVSDCFIPEADRCVESSFDGRSYSDTTKTEWWVISNYLVDATYPLCSPFLSKESNKDATRRFFENAINKGRLDNVWKLYFTNKVTPLIAMFSTWMFRNCHWFLKPILIYGTNYFVGGRAKSVIYTFVAIGGVTRLFTHAEDISNCMISSVSPCVNSAFAAKSDNSSFTKKDL